MANQFHHTKKSRVAYLPETSQGQNAGFDGDENCIDHLIVGVDQIKQVVVPNDVLHPSRARMFRHRPPILGTRGVVEVPLSFYLHGVGGVTAVDDQVAQTHLMDIFVNAIGGVDRPFSRDITAAADAHTITVSDATGYSVGSAVAVEDTTSPISAHAGNVYIREIRDISGNILTLDEDLPFTPANGDIAHAAATAYTDEDVLVDSSGAAGRTWSWWIQKGDAVNEIWMLRGSRVELKLGSFGKNTPPTFEAMIKAAYFEHEGLVAPTWTAVPQGFAPRAIGRGTTLSIRKWTGDPLAPPTAIANLHASEVQVELGVPATPVETVTEVEEYMQGLAAFSMDAAVEAGLKIKTAPYLQEYGLALEEEALYSVRYAHNGPPGYAWAIEMPVCRLIEYPTHAEVGVVGGQMLAFKAIERDPDSGQGPATELNRGNVRVVIA